MELERLENHLKITEQALLRLREAVTKPKDDFIRDSVIQRFEFSFELSWKLLKLVLEYVGIVDVNSPREAFVHAFQQGLIKNGPKWMEYLKARNISSHTYYEEAAEVVYEAARAFLNSAQEMCKLVSMKLHQPQLTL